MICNREDRLFQRTAQSYKRPRESHQDTIISQNLHMPDHDSDWPTGFRCTVTTGVHGGNECYSETCKEKQNPDQIQTDSTWRSNFCVFDTMGSHISLHIKLLFSWFVVFKDLDLCAWTEQTSPCYHMNCVHMHPLPIPLHQQMWHKLIYFMLHQPLAACCWRKLIFSTQFMHRALARKMFGYHSICKHKHNFMHFWL